MILSQAISHSLWIIILSQAIYWTFWLHPWFGSRRPWWLVSNHGQVITIIITIGTTILTINITIIITIYIIVSIFPIIVILITTMVQLTVKSLRWPSAQFPFIFRLPGDDDWWWWQWTMTSKIWTMTMMEVNCDGGPPNDNDGGRLWWRISNDNDGGPASSTMTSRLWWSSARFPLASSSHLARQTCSCYIVAKAATL